MTEVTGAVPTTVAADSDGKILDRPGLAAVGRSGRVVDPLDPSLLVPLPEGSRLYLLPGRRPLGVAVASEAARGDAAGRHPPAKRRRPRADCHIAVTPKVTCVPGDVSAVAAFLPPGYVALSLAAFERSASAPVLPLYCYCAVCWYRGGFHVPAVRVDHDPKHDPSRFDRRALEREVGRWLKQMPHNRLVSHHGKVCALRYDCPNAANLFLRRWEAPVAVAAGCNAACLGCISRQATPPSRAAPCREPNSRAGKSAVVAPQERIGFVPTVAEIVEIAVPHLKEAPRAIVSFGQGCEGEPLLHGGLIEKAIREIRRRTGRGTIHINTNGSKPGVVERLIAAGLNSIRISLNSAREPVYQAYYRCRGYSFNNVIETFRAARRGGLWVSVNYLTFPGVTDDEREFAAFAGLLSKAKPDMIQWRNLNIDPDSYMETVERVAPDSGARLMGIPELIRRTRTAFPRIRMGYFNPALAARS